MITLANPILVPLTSALIPAEPRVIYLDDGHKVAAKIETLNPLTLWDGDAYKTIGDWTQAQAEARVMELLGTNPAAVLAKL